MGMARYMVTIRLNDELYPEAYFFNDPGIANRFYYDKREFYKDNSLFTGSLVQLWKLSTDEESWNLKLSCDNP